MVDERELILDGNAAAGVLAEVFAGEVTTATSLCAGCGAEHLVGELVVYAHAPGTVIRCRSCGVVQIRIVQARDRLLVDLTGCRTLELLV